VLDRRVPPQSAEAAREHLGDVQTRVFSGLPPEAGGKRVDDALCPLERCDFVGLDRAARRVGRMAARRLGWGDFGPLPRENVSAERICRQELGAETLNALHRLTPLDAELYRRGIALYEQRITAWSHADDPRDPSVRCADAPVVSDLRFAEAIRGGGWLGRERVGDEPWFGWISGAGRAWV
jgi:hypothetical protein